MPFLNRIGLGSGRIAAAGSRFPAARDAALAPRAEAWPLPSPGRQKAALLQACSNPRCSSGWLHLLRSRETPVFEGGWCCSQECTLDRVRAALRREMDARGALRDSHRHRIPLGLAMLEQGWITQQELRAALAAQRAAGRGRLGQWLIRQGSASEEMVTRALGLQWGCPVLRLESHHPGSLAALLPRFFVDAFGALPLRVAAGKILYLGFEDRVDPALALAVERMTGLRVEVGLVEGSQFRLAHGQALEARYPPAELIEAATEEAMASVLVRAIEKQRAVEARLVRMHDCCWLRIWSQLQAGPLPEPASVRDLIATTSVG